MNDDKSQNQSQNDQITTSPPEQPHAAPENTEIKTSKGSFLKNKKVLFGIAMALVLITAVSILFLTKNKEKSPEGYIVNGNTYYNNPVLIKGLRLLKDSYCTSSEDCTDGVPSGALSYLIGKTKANEDIILFRKFAGGDNSTIILVKKGNKYEVVLPSQTSPDAWDYYGFADNVSKTSTTKLDELVVDESITIQGQQLSTIDYLKAPFINYDDKGKLVLGSPDKGTKLYTQDNFDYYVKKVDKGNYSINSITAYFKDLVSYDMATAGELETRDSKAAENIKWSKGEQTSASYKTGGGGCGSGPTYVAANVQKSDLIEVGKTPKGQTVYSLDPSNPLATEIYTTDYNKGTNLSDAAYSNLSVQQFNNKHGYFLIENGFGEYVVYINNKLFEAGGCGKPVIYLYPKTDTDVSVAVGANVTVSEPLYPIGGWKNVLARPNGQLRYQGQEYSSLFWEGQGNGEYPAITRGTVVEQKDMLATIEKQLASQGLQGQEITDFISFWKPNLPKEPYVRLTWLTLPQINVLAPLQVSPSPNTTIRVFLDFEGLSKPISLPAQEFNSPQREGFTLVEWGGLARKGLDALVFNK